MYPSRLLRRLLLIAAAALLVNCAHTRPVVNVQDQPIPPNASRLSLRDIGQHIKVAGASLNWQFLETGPGSMRGTLQVKEHSATVDVFYTQASYSIVLASSANLKQSGDDTIHRRYNQWVTALRNKINSQLSAVVPQSS
jgi:hypothetical protein